MTTVRRITAGVLDPSIFSKMLTQRIYSLETRSLGSITLREPIKAVDPVTGVETVFGPLPDGSFGFKENMKDYILLKQNKVVLSSYLIHRFDVLFVRF